MNLLIDSQYNLLKKIGFGAFSSIYLGKKLSNNQDVAIKLEPIKTKHTQLEYEAKILRLLQGGKGIPQLHWYGEEGDFKIMIMDLLGPSLNDLFEYCNKKFSLKTVLMLADQMITLIEYLHENNFIHRDVKPENFLIGREKQSDQIFMIDYGISNKFRDPRTGLHIPFQDNRSLAGVARYVSINTHLGIEQSRRDDLESLGYCFLYFLRGDLPWMGVQAPDNKKKYDKIREIKIATPIEVLCQNFPQEFEIYLKYCRSLKFEERPDYVWLKRLFKNLYEKLEYEWNLSFDWAELSVYIENEQNKYKISTTEVIKEEENLDGTLEVLIIRAKNLPNLDMIDQSDPFCRFAIYEKTIQDGKKEVLQENQIQSSRTTKAIMDDNNPLWNYKSDFKLSVMKNNFDNYVLEAKVYDKDFLTDDFIGQTEISLSKIFKKPNKTHKELYDLFNNQGKQVLNALIEIELKFIPN